MREVGSPQQRGELKVDFQTAEATKAGSGPQIKGQDDLVTMAESLLGILGHGHIRWEPQLSSELCERS